MVGCECRTFENDFTKIVPPELAAIIVARLRRGEIVEFPNQYELSQVKGNLVAASWIERPIVVVGRFWVSQMREVR
jgi:hypothetical protein